MKQSDFSPKPEENKLEKYFDSLKKENFDDTFEAAGNWIRSANINLTNKKSERKFLQMKNYLSANKFKLAYTFLILAFVVAACNYPVTQQESLGDVMTFNVSSDNADAVSRIKNLDWFKKSESNYNENIDGDKGVISYKVILPKESHDNISLYKQQLESIPGINDLKIIPLSETVKRPAYSALLNDVFKININASNMNDSEVANEIQAELKKEGIENAKVTFERNPEGIRMLTVDIPEQSMQKDGGFDVTVKDGNNVNRIKEVRKHGEGDEDRFKNKTDAEIKQMVKQDLGNPDLKDENIEIIREGDKVKVKVKVSKDNGKIQTEDEIERK